MIKGVHQLTLRPNMLISLTDHLQLSMDRWIDGQPGGPMYGSRIILSREVGGGGGGGGPGPTAYRIRTCRVHTELTKQNSLTFP